MRRGACAVRLAALLALTGAGLLPGAAGAGPGQTPAPTVALVTPTNSALVHSSHVSFTWRVDWPRSVLVPAGTVLVVHRYASDAALTKEVVAASRTCPAANVGCWSRYRPRVTFYGRYYWQVTLSGAVQATSGTALFSVAGPRPKPDRRKPLVRAIAGSATRGRHAVFSARVLDDSGEARLDAKLFHRGVPVLGGQTSFAPAAWGAPRRVRSSRRVPATLTPGTYRLCVTAWDRAGNRGRSCARYSIR